MGIQSAFGGRSSNGDSLVIVETILGMWVQFMAGPVAKCVAREVFWYILRLGATGTCLCNEFFY